jgi:hypothetical protein
MKHLLKTSAELLATSFVFSSNENWNISHAGEILGLEMCLFGRAETGVEHDRQGVE